MENISCLDDVVESILRTENFSPDDIDEALLFDKRTGQTIESIKFTNSDTPKNEFNNMTNTNMETVPNEDVLLYSTDILSVPSFSSNYKEMDQGQKINPEPFDPTDLFEFSDEEFRQMVNLQNSFDIQEKVVAEECPRQDIYIQSLDFNHSTDVDTILKTKVEYMSSTVDVDIPMDLPGEGALYSVNPYDISKFNNKSHVISHMLANHNEHPFCCVLCNDRYHRKSDLTKHMKILKGPNNVSDSSQFTVPIHIQSVTHGKGSENKGDIYQEPKTKKDNGRGKGRDKRKDPLMALKLYSKPHTCNLCGLSYTYENALLKHARLRHNHEGVIIVSTQKSNSDSYELTILANNKFNKVSSYSCDSCEAVFNRFDFFKRHQRLHINIELGNIEGESNRCIDSGLLLKSLPELELHTKQHLIVTSFPKKSKCSVCDKQFGVTDEVSNLDRSQLHSDSLTEYVCRLCKNLCNDDKVTSDDNVNKNDKGVTCDILDEEVADKQVLINHKAGHVNTNSVSQNSSTIKMFPCNSCDKVFKNRLSQKIHSRLHAGEWPFICKYCNKSFADCDILKKHERIHTGKWPYACPACKKTFIQRAALCKHIKLLHAGIKIGSDNVNIYKCEICGFFCQSSTDFYLHLLQHSDENRAKYKVRTCKDQRHSKLGNQKNTCGLVPNAMAGHFDTEQVSYASKYTDLKSELTPKKQCFALKDEECTKPCSTILYYSSRSDSTVMNSSLAEESKKNYVLIDPDDQISVNYKDLTRIEKKNEQPEFVVQNYNKISNTNYTKVKHKYQHRGKFGIQKNICCLIPSAIAGQLDTDISEDEPVPTDDEQCIQSVINEDEMRYNSMSVGSPSESQAETIKIVNGKLQKNKQKSSEQVSPGSKYTVLKSEHKPKKQRFVLKDGECTRTCSTILYYYSRSYSNVMNSSLAEKSKENDSLIEPDQKTIE